MRTSGRGVVAVVAVAAVIVVGSGAAGFRDHLGLGCCSNTAA